MSSVTGPTPVAAPLSEVTACVAEILGISSREVDPDVLLSKLGLESFTAVRLRRRLRDELGLDLPLTAFLGETTARTIALGAASPNSASPSSPSSPSSGGEEDDSFPLTPIQLAYLIGRDPQFPLGGVGTFFYYEYDRVAAPSDPNVDVRRLEAAWNQVVERHPMLRMVVGPDARQRILPSVPRYRFDVTDLREVDSDKVGQTLANLRAECSHQLRPSDTWPLFDIRAALLPDGRTRLYVGVDVLALDLGCWFQLMREWGSLVADPRSQLPTGNDVRGFRPPQAERPG